MKTAKTFVSAIALLPFLSPILSNPAIPAAVSDVLFDWRTLLAAPLVFVALVILGLRLRLSLEDRSSESSPFDTQIAESSEFETQISKETPDTQSDTVAKEQDEQEMTDRELAEQLADQQSDILGGQGGTRDREFGIERAQPEAGLSDHLDHLREELEDDREMASDIDALEEIAAEVEGEQRIPARCPQEHCDALWTERTIFDINNGQFEVLDDEQIICLECEQTTTLE